MADKGSDTGIRDGEPPAKLRDSQLLIQKGSAEDSGLPQQRWAQLRRIRIKRGVSAEDIPGLQVNTQTPECHMSPALGL
ncbi:MAG TPA: hypothetical protein VFJ27_01100, partial [Terriglobia bacterium]|nr:hypothetical protein [Terriglobia bacterium]